MAAPCLRREKSKCRSEPASTFRRRGPTCGLVAVTTQDGRCSKRGCLSPPSAQTRRCRSLCPRVSALLSVTAVGKRQPKSPVGRRLDIDISFFLVRCCALRLGTGGQQQATGPSVTVGRRLRSSRTLFSMGSSPWASRMVQSRLTLERSY